MRLEPPQHMLSEVQIAWVAGLLEGEGSFHLQPARRRMGIRCGMTDKDVIERLGFFLGGTIICRPKERDAKATQDFYQWALNDRQAVVKTLHLILVYMGRRRRARIFELLDWDCNNPQQPQVRGAHGRFVKTT